MAPQALRMYQESERLFGEHHVTIYNMGLCHREMGNPEQALKEIERCLGLQGEYGRALGTLAELRAVVDRANAEPLRG